MKFSFFDFLSSTVRILVERRRKFPGQCVRFRCTGNTVVPALKNAAASYVIVVLTCISSAADVAKRPEREREQPTPKFSDSLMVISHLRNLALPSPPGFSHPGPLCSFCSVSSSLRTEKERRERWWWWWWWFSSAREFSLSLSLSLSLEGVAGANHLFRGVVLTRRTPCPNRRGCKRDASTGS